MQSAALVAALLGSAAPASALWPVIDVTAITQILAQVKQTVALVSAARSNLQALPGGVGMSDVQGRIASVTSILQRAQSACQGALSGRALPDACRVEANTAQTQASQLGSEMAQIRALQNAANGVGGGLAAQQLNAKALVEVATQLQELRQAQSATQLQKQIDDRAVNASLHGQSSIGNPYGP